MGFLKWGSSIKARRFDYIPRYYDPEKEERALRIKKLRQEEGVVDTELSQSRIRAGFRQKYRPQSAKGGQMNRLIRLFVILVVLMGATYLILLSNMDWLNAFLG